MSMSVSQFKWFRFFNELAGYDNGSRITLVGNTGMLTYPERCDRGKKFFKNVCSR